jgi:hypothetical protein
MKQHPDTKRLSMHELGEEFKDNKMLMYNTKTMNETRCSIVSNVYVLVGMLECEYILTVEKREEAMTFLHWIYSRYYNTLNYADTLPPKEHVEYLLSQAPI